MISLLLFISFCFKLFVCENEVRVDLKNHASDPDAFRNITGLVTSKGYPLEEHTVLTEDGYLLSVQRIPHGREGKSQGDVKGAVLLIHGIFSDATVWTMDFPEQSLGFILADENYDVWFLNTRGCNYSRKSIKFSTNEYNFWNFSFHEIGVYDIPATIDYILKTTGEGGVYIIGHSQGTTATFVMLSELPEYDDKVKLFIALAPVVYVGYAKSISRKIVPFRNIIKFANILISNGEISPDNLIINLVKSLWIADGVDISNLNETRKEVYLSHYPSSTSMKSFVHYAQLYKSKKFRKYDYGCRRNVISYHQEEPPDYNLTSITAPVSLIWSKNDDITDPKDIDILRRQLNSLVFDYCIPYPHTHSDFLVAKNAPKLIYKPILQLLADY